MPDFIPQRDGELVTWSAIFTQQIVADPASWGVSESDADELAARQAEWEAAYARAMATDTRTRITILAKTDSKRALLEIVRQVAWVVRISRTVSDAQRASLGLVIAKRRPSPIAPPATQPVVTLAAKGSHALDVTLVDERSPSRPAKPKQVAGAHVYVHIGNEPPADPQAWTFHSTQTRTRFALTLPGPLAFGQQVWVYACWVNPRAIAGDPSQPATIRVVGGPSLNMASLARAA